LGELHSQKLIGIDPRTAEHCCMEISLLLATSSVCTIR